MGKPLLQIALDAQYLETALVDVKQIEHNIDIIEVGTILACSEGMRAMRILRALYPNHILVCDLKTTDAGATLAKMAFEAGADWLTVSAAAHPATKAACQKVAEEFNKIQPNLDAPKEIQIELYGNWNFDEVKNWLQLGIKQAIYHRSRDAELSGLSWSNQDIENIEKLDSLGIELSITGGITPDDLHLFKNTKNLKAFIAGRALVGKSGREIAEQLKHKIGQFWI